jgi:murein DD-endopeptidase MepM/ murein hydrolase activator NlpD
MKKYIFCLLLVVLIILPFTIFSQEVSYPNIPGAIAPQNFLGEAQSQGEILPLFLEYFFQLFLIISVAVAFFVILYGGIVYISSSGDPEKRKNGKNWILGAMQGTLIIFASYALLYTLDSQLVLFQQRQLDDGKKEEKIHLEWEIKNIYYQIPFGLLIEDAILNETAQSKLYDVLDATYKAEDTSNAIEQGSKQLLEIIKICPENEPCCDDDGKVNSPPVEKRETPKEERKAPDWVTNLSPPKQSPKPTKKEKEEELYSSAIPIPRGDSYGEEEQAVSDAEKEEIENDRAEDTPLREEDGARYSSDYGYRKDPFGSGETTWHNGVDIVTDNKSGADINTTHGGEVIYADDSGGRGGKVVIVEYYNEKSNEKYHILYAHLASFSVQKGEPVTAGQKIGTTGSTGATTGEHLHYEVRNSNGDALDPIANGFLPKEIGKTSFNKSFLSSAWSLSNQINPEKRIALTNLNLNSLKSFPLTFFGASLLGGSYFASTLSSFHIDYISLFLHLSLIITILFIVSIFLSSEKTNLNWNLFKEMKNNQRGDLKYPIVKYVAKYPIVKYVKHPIVKYVAPVAKKALPVLKVAGKAIVGLVGWKVLLIAGLIIGGYLLYRHFSGNDNGDPDVVIDYPDPDSDNGDKYKDDEDEDKDDKDDDDDWWDLDDEDEDEDKKKEEEEEEKKEEEKPEVSCPACPDIAPPVQAKIAEIEGYMAQLARDLDALLLTKEPIKEDLYQLYKVVMLKSLGYKKVFGYNSLLLERRYYEREEVVIDTDREVSQIGKYSWDWSQWINSLLYRIEIGGKVIERNDPVTFYLRMPESRKIVEDALRLAKEAKARDIQTIKSPMAKQSVSYSPNVFQKVFSLVTGIFSNTVFRATLTPTHTPGEFVTCGMEIPVGEVFELTWDHLIELLDTIDEYVAEGRKLIEQQAKMNELARPCDCPCQGDEKCPNTCGACKLTCDLAAIEAAHQEVLKTREKMREIAAHIELLTYGHFNTPTEDLCHPLNEDVRDDQEKVLCKGGGSKMITKQELITRKLNYSRYSFDECITRPEHLEDVLEGRRAGRLPFFGPFIEQENLPRYTKTKRGGAFVNTSDFNWFCCSDYLDR